MYGGGDSIFFRVLVVVALFVFCVILTVVIIKPTEITPEPVTHNLQITGMHWEPSSNINIYGC